MDPITPNTYISPLQAGDNFLFVGAREIFPSINTATPVATAGPIVAENTYSMQLEYNGNVVAEGTGQQVIVYQDGNLTGTGSTGNSATGYLIALKSGVYTVRYSYKNKETVRNQELVYVSYATYNFTVINNRQPLKLWTVLDVINRTLDIAEPRLSGPEKPRFRLKGMLDEPIVNPDGTVNDSTCVTPLACLRSGKAVALDCLEIDPQVIGQQSPAQASRRLIEWQDELLAKFPFLSFVPRRWIFECAEGGQMLRLQFYEDSGEETYLVTDKSIMGDVKRVRSMLSEMILLFHVADNVNTIQLVEDIENYVFDEKTGDIKKQQRDDTIDSLEYATKLYFNAPIVG